VVHCGGREPAEADIVGIVGVTDVVALTDVDDILIVPSKYLYNRKINEKVQVCYLLMASLFSDEGEQK
jgi:hypothetical protein